MSKVAINFETDKGLMVNTLHLNHQVTFFEPPNLQII